MASTGSLKISDFGEVVVCLAQNELETRVAHTPIGRIGLTKLWNFDTRRSRDEVIMAPIAFAQALDEDPFGAAVGSSN
jgi:hypothetical protein